MRIKGKFEIGDIVRVVGKTDNSDSFEYGLQVRDNFEKVGTVSSESISTTNTYYVKELKGTFKEKNLRLVTAAKDVTTITIVSDGKKFITATMGDKTVTASRHPDDDFDLKTGVEIAIDRLFEPQIGDDVVITDPNPEKVFSIDSEWVVRHIKDVNLAVKYAYDCRFAISKFKPNCFKVVYKKGDLAYIQRETATGECYLVDIHSLKKV